MSSSAEIIHWQGNLLNPVDYAFAVRHPNWLLRVEWCERDGYLCVFQSGRRVISHCWGRMDHLLLTLMRSDWLLGFWNKYLIFKDHFVACSRQPSQVFSVCLWFTPYDSINSCWRNMCIIKFKKPASASLQDLLLKSQCMHQILFIAVKISSPIVSDSESEVIALFPSWWQWSCSWKILSHYTNFHC